MVRAGLHCGREREKTAIDQCPVCRLADEDVRQLCLTLGERSRRVERDCVDLGCCLDVFAALEQDALPATRGDRRKDRRQANLSNDGLVPERKSHDSASISPARPNIAQSCVEQIGGRGTG
jgi:hypothetical protein